MQKHTVISKTKEAYLNVGQIWKALRELETMGKITYHMRIYSDLTWGVMATFAVGIGKENKLACFQFTLSRVHTEISLISVSGAMTVFLVGCDCPSSFIRTEILNCVDEKRNSWQFEDKCIDRLDHIFKEMSAKDDSFPLKYARKATMSQDINEAIDCWVKYNNSEIPLQIKSNFTVLVKHKERHPNVPGWQYKPYSTDEQIISQLQAVFEEFLTQET